jgi:hypothetical protein
MAAFCTKCGASLPANTGLCPACGAPTGEGVVIPPAAHPPVPSVSPYTAYPPPMMAYPAAPPKSSGGAMKIVLIVLAVVVGIGVLAAGVLGYNAWRFAHSIANSVHTDSKGNATVSMLGGVITAGKDVDVNAADLGVPIYPGAARGKGGLHMKLPTMSMVSAVYLTTDPVGSVAGFYKGKLGENEKDSETGSGMILTSGREGADAKDTTMITISPAAGQNNGKTQFTIMHTTSTK